MNKPRLLFTGNVSPPPPFTLTFSPRLLSLSLPLSDCVFPVSPVSAGVCETTLPSSYHALLTWLACLPLPFTDTSSSSSQVMSKARLRISVKFGETKLLVPCGDGAITVDELIEKAIGRYKKHKKMVRNE